MKILFIGLGSIAKKHIKAINSFIDCEFFALRSSKNSENHQDVTNIIDLEPTINSIDFIILSNPTFLHGKYLKILTNYNKPIFIEKPPLCSLSEIEIISKKIKNQNIKTYVACNMRFNPSIIFLKNKLKTNKINEINIYAGSYLPDWRPNKDFRAIYSSQKKMGGGVHLDLFHEIDYASWIFGIPNKSRAFFSSKSTLKISAIDYANYLWDYDKFNLSIILNYFRKKPKRYIEILFDDDTWNVDLINNKIISDSKGLIFSSEQRISDTYVLQMKYFIECLKNDKPIMNDFDESIDRLKLCLTQNYNEFKK